MPGTYCMKRTSVHMKNMQIKQRCNGCENILGPLRNGPQAQVVRTQMLDVKAIHLSNNLALLL